MERYGSEAAAGDRGAYNANRQYQYQSQASLGRTTEGLTFTQRNSKKRKHVIKMQKPMAFTAAKDIACGF
jgi:hypothetical protein